MTSEEKYKLKSCCWYPHWCTGVRVQLSTFSVYSCTLPFLVNQKKKWKEKQKTAQTHLISRTTMKRSSRLRSPLIFCPYQDRRVRDAVIFANWIFLTCAMYSAQAIVHAYDDQRMGLEQTTVEEKSLISQVFGLEFFALE